MELPVAVLRRFALALLLTAASVWSSATLATNVQFVGTVGYSFVGSTAVLTADRVENFASAGTSGTLHMELWAFPTPYNGNAQIGYKLATHSLGVLQGGHYYFNISSGTIGFSTPPNGSWAAVMVLTEFDNGSSNGGYSVRDWINFSNPLVIGPPVSPGQLAFSVSSLSFGNVFVGAVSSAQTVVVTNVGGTAVSIASAGLTNTVDFAALTNCPTILQPGANCVGTVTFSPHASGFLTSSIVVYSSGVGSPQSIQLTGTGVVATQPGQLSMAAALTFPNQTVGTTSAPQSVTISNIGGQGVTISSLTLTTSDFSGSSNGCSFIAAGSFCTVTVTFSPTVVANRFATINVVSNGVGSPQSIQVSGLGIAAGTPPPSTAVAIEYYHAAFDHYFVTAIADEITKLDNGTFVGWVRTGNSFKVYTNSQAAFAAVCRFFSTSFAPKSSHFYTPDAPECLVVKSNPNWAFEAVVFYMAKADIITGNCPTATQPIYRLYNNGQGAAPNHRYTTSLTTRTQMLGQSWSAEGYGPIGVIMCSPL